MITLENQLRFLANYKYMIKQNVTRDPLHSFTKLSSVVKDTEDETKNNFDSICNSTMVGFVQDLASVGTMENHKITCFYAEVDPKHPIVEPVSSLALQ